MLSVGPSEKITQYFKSCLRTINFLWDDLQQFLGNLPEGTCAISSAPPVMANAFGRSRNVTWRGRKPAEQATWKLPVKRGQIPCDLIPNKGWESHHRFFTANLVSRSHWTIELLKWKVSFWLARLWPSTPYYCLVSEHVDSFVVGGACAFWFLCECKPWTWRVGGSLCLWQPVARLCSWQQHQISTFARWGRVGRRHHP